MYALDNESNLEGGGRKRTKKKKERERAGLTRPFHVEAGLHLERVAQASYRDHYPEMM